MTPDSTAKRTGHQGKRLGSVVDLSYRGHLVVLCEFAPEVGATVYDSRRQRAGRVVRVFGPVAAPYATVNPAKKGKAVMSFVGGDLFVE